jgi:hypothetical protein
MTHTVKETSNLTAVCIGHGWIQSGDGSYTTRMSHELGITITQVDYPDGTTEFVFGKAAPHASTSTVVE